MNNLLEKIKLYKEKNKLLKEKHINDFYLLSDDIKQQYEDICIKKEFVNVISYLSFVSLITSLIEYIYTINIDNKLKYDLLNIINKGINPIIKDINNPLYMYLTIMTIVSYIICNKSIELGSEINKSKKYYEYKEPKLKGFKYL